ncbi:hypothetical protein STEG23_005535 [Scotinomys teguina]
MEVVAAALRCQLLLILLMAAMLSPGLKVSSLLAQRKITRIIELQESIGKDFLDSETCLLLAAPIYLKEKMGVEDIPPRGVYLLLGKNRHLGKKLFLPGLLDDMLYKLDMLDP